VVRLGTEIGSGRQIAVKCTSRDGLPEEDEEMLRQEAKILMSLHHPNIVKCFDIIEENKSFYVVLEMLKGGELFKRIIQKDHYNEHDAREVIYILINAIKFCHDKGIVHRDLKPENLLLTSDADDADIKIADFGFAAYDHGDNQLFEQCGTPDYVAPEILRNDPYGPGVDMWAIGVITYVLLGGYLPFHDPDEWQLLKNVKTCKYKFDKRHWKGVSEEAKDLIRGLLTIDVTKRFTADQALNHSWVRLGEKELMKRDLGENLALFKRQQKLAPFRKAVHMVILARRMRIVKTEIRQPSVRMTRRLSTRASSMAVRMNVSNESGRRLSKMESCRLTLSLDSIGVDDMLGDTAFSSEVSAPSKVSTSPTHKP